MGFLNRCFIYSKQVLIYLLLTYCVILIPIIAQVRQTGVVGWWRILKVSSIQSETVVNAPVSAIDVRVVSTFRSETRPDGRVVLFAFDRHSITRTSIGLARWHLPQLNTTNFDISLTMRHYNWPYSLLWNCVLVTKFTLTDFLPYHYRHILVYVCVDVSYFSELKSLLLYFLFTARLCKRVSTVRYHSARPLVCILSRAKVNFPSLLYLVNVVSRNLGN